MRDELEHLLIAVNENIRALDSNSDRLVNLRAMVDKEEDENKRLKQTSLALHLKLKERALALGYINKKQADSTSTVRALQQLILESHHYDKSAQLPENVINFPLNNSATPKRAVKLNNSDLFPPHLLKGAIREMLAILTKVEHDVVSVIFGIDREEASLLSGREMFSQTHTAKILNLSLAKVGTIYGNSLEKLIHSGRFQALKPLVYKLDCQDIQSREQNLLSELQATINRKCYIQQ